MRRIAEQFPARFVAFDLLHFQSLGGSLIGEPYRVRRAALEQLFERFELTAPWQLCPATTDPATIREWITDWVEKFGFEGVVWKAPEDAYRPGVRGWRRYKVRTTEVVIGAVTGRVNHPQDLFLGRLDREGNLRYVGRSTPLQPAATAELGAVLAPAPSTHPWKGRRFSAAWGSGASIAPTLVEPAAVAEISVDAAQDDGVYRHLVKYLRVRAELRPTDVQRFDDTEERA